MNNLLEEFGGLIYIPVILAVITFFYKLLEIVTF